MKSILVTFILLIVSSVASAQQIPEVKQISYEDPYIFYDSTERDTAAENSNMIVRIYHNDHPPVITKFNCTGTAKPFECKATAPKLEIGNNMFYLSFQNPPVNNVEQPESPKSAPLNIFYAVNQKEIITNTERQTMIICQDGSFTFARITDASKMSAVLNAIKRPLVVYNILATSNAIYIFSCLPVSQ